MTEWGGLERSSPLPAELLTRRQRPPQPICTQALFLKTGACPVDAVVPNFPAEPRTRFKELLERILAVLVVFCNSTACNLISVEEKFQRRKPHLRVPQSSVAQAWLAFAKAEPIRNTGCKYSISRGRDDANTKKSTGRPVAGRPSKLRAIARRCSGASGSEETDSLRMGDRTYRAHSTPGGRSRCRLLRFSTSTSVWGAL